MRMLIILFLTLSVFAADEEKTTGGLFEKKKADFLEKMKKNDNPGPEDIECVEKAETRNSLNQCEKTMKGKRREDRKNLKEEKNDLDE